MVRTEAGPGVLCKEVMPVPKKDPSGSSGPESTPGPSYFHLSKLALEDDIEAYLYAFETMVMAARWPPALWITILDSYTTRPAQVVLKTIPTQEVTNYERVEATILNRYKVTEETQRQCFRASRYKPEDWPKVLIAELKEYATQWLKPQMAGERAIVNKIVLEQVCEALPTGVRAWLMRGDPTFLYQVTTYLENYFLAECTTCPDTGGPERTLPKAKAEGPSEEPMRATNTNKPVSWVLDHKLNLGALWGWHPPQEPRRPDPPQLEEEPKGPKSP